MLTAGVSVPRVLRPLLLLGLLTVAASTALNYALAPHADVARRAIISTEQKVRRESQIDGQIFRNRTDSRTWFIQSFRRGQSVFNNVEILQQDSRDNIVKNYLAAKAIFHPDNKSWELLDAKVVSYDRTRQYHARRIVSLSGARPLDGNAISLEQRKRPRGIFERP